MIDEIYRMQRMFNNRVIGFDVLAIEREEDRVKWLRNYLTAYDQELKELLESLDGRAFLGKGAADAPPGDLDLHNVRVEIIDMLHFLLSMFQVLGEKGIDGERLEGKPGTLDECFRALAPGFAARFGAPLAGDGSPAAVNARLLGLAHESLVSEGRLLDCVPWKWWAKQAARWDRAREILYGELFPQWCMMAAASGMSAAGAEELYFRKNKLNFDRQDKGYANGTYAKVDGDGREDNEKI